MSVSQVTKGKENKQLNTLDIQSKVIEHQFISEKKNIPIFEYNSPFIENNSQQLFSQNVIEQKK